VTKRYTETDLASQATQANVTVLNPALVPLEPSFPKPLGKTMAIAAALGLLFGFAAAFLLEMRDRRVRSEGDLAELLALPVLGVITRTTQPGRWLAFWRRGATLVTQ
jgi:capsular polysaccharide biosynthesis protein